MAVEHPFSEPLPGAFQTEPVTLLEGLHAT
jgi:hypothetical protein